MLSIFIRIINFVIIFSNTIFNKVSISIICFLNLNVLSRAINFSRQCHFKIWLDCHKFKKFPFLIMPMSTKCQKNENKMTINVIQHDDRL
jgi:hypothetical protein